MGRGNKKNRHRNGSQQVRQQTGNLQDDLSSHGTPRLLQSVRLRTPLKRHGNSIIDRALNDIISNPFETRDSGRGMVVTHCPRFQQRRNPSHAQERSRAFDGPNHSQRRLEMQGSHVDTSTSLEQKKWCREMDALSLDSTPLEPERENGVGFCTECSTVRRANSTMRDWLAKALLVSSCVVQGWSDEVGVTSGSGDEMDWQPEPVTRVLLVSSGDGRGDGHRLPRQGCSELGVFNNWTPRPPPDFGEYQTPTAPKNARFRIVSPITPPSTPPSTSPSF